MASKLKFNFALNKLFRAIAVGIVAFVVMMILGSVVSMPTLAQRPSPNEPKAIQIVGPVSLDKDLRALPYIPPSSQTHPRLGRHPLSQNALTAQAPTMQNRTLAPSPKMPSPLLTFGGITEITSGCNCLPSDTDGDVGPSHYIQSVNTSIKIFDKTGGTLSGPTTYNSLFSAMGPSTPCGNNQNDGDGVVFFDHLANRWVASDFAFSAFPGSGPFYQCIAVSKNSNPVSGGWWLYALQTDPSNTNWLGDYPKFGLWQDAYYLSSNLFNGSSVAFEGVRVYALDRTAMLNGSAATVVAFTILPATLGNAYSLLPATFRFGAPPPNTPEYFLAVNSSVSGGDVENQVFAWRFHPDFVTPANSTFGVGVNHSPNGTITVTNFVEALQGSGSSYTSNLVPQTGTGALLDTLGDKLMYPLYYQNLNGTESLYATQTINNNQGGTGPTAIRWYQFNVTGGTIPSGAAQQQTFNNGDSLWRWMPSLAVDVRGNFSIGYSVSSSGMNPGIRYAGRLASDTANSLAQGEAILISGGGHQTDSSGRWGDYSATAVDPIDGCTFWHTNEYYSTSSQYLWNTRIGNFRFPSCKFSISLFLPLILR